MKCRNCGAELLDVARFCAVCGTAVVQEKIEEQQEQKVVVAAEDKPASKEVENVDLEKQVENVKQKAPIKDNQNKFIGIVVAVALILFLAGAGITGYFVSENIEKKNAQLEAEVEAEANTYLNFCNKAKEYKKRFVTFYMEQSEKSKLRENMNFAREQIVNRGESEKLEQWLKDMERFVSDTETKNNQKVEELKEKFSDYDTLLMTDEEEKEFNGNIAKFNEYVKNKEYNQAVEYANESYKYAEKVTQKKDGWDISVVQKDISSYPTVRLYLDITEDGDRVVDNLDKKYFILSEKQGADSEYLKQRITKATQLNQEERLNISMLADVSGSMDIHMPQVQSVMTNFLENVQFEVGDQIELSSFCNDFQIEEYFTSDRDDLVRRVNELDADGGTKLYDSLIESAQRAYLQEGARCVIAFTDGLDNCSTSTEEDVIDYANQYNVPIFIIGIGVDDEYEYQQSLRNIAESTGGFYRDVEDVSTSLEEVYNSIYRQQKEIYCLEYKTSADISQAGKRDVHLYIKGEENGGLADYSYAPKEDYFSVLFGKFLNAYSRSVENKDYSYLEDSNTLKPGGGIDKELRAYIKKKDLEIAQILHYEVLGLEFKDKNTCILKTRESFDISQTKSYDADIKNPHKKKNNVDATQIYDLLMERGYYEEDLEGSKIRVKKTRVLKGKYKLVRTKDGEWRLKDYADRYKVESSDVYFACEEGDYNSWE